jgi:hypothetical protein
MCDAVCPLVSAEDRARLEAIVADRNRAQKHVARANVAEVVRRARVCRSAAQRWQRRFVEAGSRACCATPAKMALGEHISCP